MAGARADQAAPPPLDLDDQGVEWHREGASLVVERHPSLRAAVMPALGTFAFAAIGFFLVRAGEASLGLAFSAVALVGLGGVLLALSRHTALRAGRYGLLWETNLPRRRAGNWARDAITAVRVRGEGRGPWSVGKQVFAEVRVRGEWVVVGLGHSPARANDFARGLGAALGVRDEEGVALAQVA